MEFCRTLIDSKGLVFLTILWNFKGLSKTYRYLKTFFTQLYKVLLRFKYCSVLLHTIHSNNITKSKNVLLFKLLKTWHNFQQMLTLLTFANKLFFHDEYTVCFENLKSILTFPRFRSRKRRLINKPNRS